MADVDITKQLLSRVVGAKSAGIQWVGSAAELTIQLPESTTTSNTSPQPAINTLETRVIALKTLADEVSQCQRCPELSSTRTQTVFGVGPADAEIMFVGEAPGADEDRQGEPFVGAAGQMLNRIITASGLKRSDIFICNILRCRPPGNRTPKPDECANCREYLEKTISLVQPKIIIAWGAVAAQNLLKTSTGITKLRGQMYDFNGIPVICTFHPASLLEGRSPQNKKFVWEDMKTMLTHLGKPIPTNTPKSDAT